LWEYGNEGFAARCIGKRGEMNWIARKHEAVPKFVEQVMFGAIWAPSAKAEGAVKLDLKDHLSYKYLHA
jgi:hypothetical protein